MRSAPLCPCGWVHAFGDVRSVGRFQPEVFGYVAYVRGKVGTIRGTRRQAMSDVCPQWQPAATRPAVPVVPSDVGDGQ